MSYSRTDASYLDDGVVTAEPEATGVQALLQAPMKKICRTMSKHKTSAGLARLQQHHRKATRAAQAVGYNNEGYHSAGHNSATVPMLSEVQDGSGGAPEGVAFDSVAQQEGGNGAREKNNASAPRKKATQTNGASQAAGKAYAKKVSAKNGQVSRRRSQRKSRESVGASNETAIGKQRADHDLDLAMQEIRQRRQAVRRRALAEAKQAQAANRAPQDQQAQPVKRQPARKATQRGEVPTQAPVHPVNMDAREFRASQRAQEFAGGRSMTNSTQSEQFTRHNVPSSDDALALEGGLSLAPVEEGAHHGMMGHGMAPAPQTAESSFGLPAAAPAQVNMGTYYAQPRSKRGVNQAPVAETRKRPVKRRRQPIPKQFIYLAIFAALGCLTIWQEVEYGYVGSLVSYVQAQGGFAVVVSDLWASLWQ